MNEAIESMLSQYKPGTPGESVQALREILQSIVLLGLWRAKIFENTAFYGGTALRILYGLDRFSEDLDFSLLQPDKQFNLSPWHSAIVKELAAFGFEAEFTEKHDQGEQIIQRGFMEINTRQALLAINSVDKALRIPKNQKIKIRIEVDNNPPGGFDTDIQYVLQPVPFSVRTYALPDLFAGKLHAALFRRWERRVKGRNWYDLVWFVSNYPRLHLSHLKTRMRHSGDWQTDRPLTPDTFKQLYLEKVAQLDVEQAQKDVLPFLQTPDSVAVWSRDFFRHILEKVEFI